MPHLWNCKIQQQQQMQLRDNIQDSRLLLYTAVLLNWSLGVMFQPQNRGSRRGVPYIINTLVWMTKHPPTNKRKIHLSACEGFWFALSNERCQLLSLALLKLTQTTNYQKNKTEIWIDCISFLNQQHSLTTASSSPKPHHSVWSSNCISDGASLHDESLTLRFVL